MAELVDALLLKAGVLFKVQEHKCLSQERGGTAAPLKGGSGKQHHKGRRENSTTIKVGKRGEAITSVYLYSMESIFD